MEDSCYFLCGPSNINLVLQERRIAREPSSNSHSDDHQQTNRDATKLGDRRFDGASASDTSEGDSGRKHHQPTRYR